MRREQDSRNLANLGGGKTEVRLEEEDLEVLQGCESGSFVALRLWVMVGNGVHELARGPGKLDEVGDGDRISTIICGVQ